MSNLVRPKYDREGHLHDWYQPEDSHRSHIECATCGVSLADYIMQERLASGRAGVQAAVEAYKDVIAWTGPNTMTKDLIREFAERRLHKLEERL